MKLNENMAGQLTQGSMVWKLNVTRKRSLPSIEIWLRQSGKACKTSHGTRRSDVMFQVPYLQTASPLRGQCIPEATSLLALQMSTWLEQLKCPQQKATLGLLKSGHHSPTDLRINGCELGCRLKICDQSRGSRGIFLSASFKSADKSEHQALPNNTLWKEIRCM